MLAEDFAFVYCFLVLDDQIRVEQLSKVCMGSKRAQADNAHAS